MTQTRYDIVTGDERPDLLEKGDAVFGLVWPEFMSHGVTANKYWARLYTDFAEFQFVLLKPGTEDIVAVGNSLPLYWDGEKLPDEGWDWAMTTGFEQRASGISPNIQCALSITIFPEYLGRGISSLVVEAMIAIGNEHGLNRLIAPVRPNLKARYPITPMDDYVRWRRDDGLPFDPWMRVHARMGAGTVGVCPRAFRVEGSVAQWEEWAEMVFPETGPYVIPVALVPVEIDREADKGVYLEPNVWMIHTIK